MIFVPFPRKALSPLNKLLPQISTQSTKVLSENPSFSLSLQGRTHCGRQSYMRLFGWIRCSSVFLHTALFGTFPNV